MIEEIPWTAGERGGSGAGRWLGPLRGSPSTSGAGDGSSMKERYDRAEARAKEAESRYEEVRASRRRARSSPASVMIFARRWRTFKGSPRAWTKRVRRWTDSRRRRKRRSVRLRARESRSERSGTESGWRRISSKERTRRCRSRSKRKGGSSKRWSGRPGETANTEARIAEKAKELENLEAREREIRMRASMGRGESGEDNEESGRRSPILGDEKGDSSTGSGESGKENEEKRKKKSNPWRRKRRFFNGKWRIWKRKQGNREENGALGNLTSPPGCVGGERTGNPREEEGEALKEALSLIRGQGLEFHQRMVWRLHTSAQGPRRSSPLTVLAGISGTGKTQLPRGVRRSDGNVSAGRARSTAVGTARWT